MAAGGRGGVSSKAMELAWRLCEQPRPEIAGDVLRTHFGGVGDELVRVAGLVATAPAEVAVMSVDHDDRPLELEWDPEHQALTGFHPEAGVVVVGQEARRRYRLDVDWLLSLIRHQLGVPAATRTVPLVDGVLWDLGDAWIGKRKASVLFARRLVRTGNLDAAGDALTRRVGRPPGILLTSTPTVPRHVVLPGQHSIIPITGCVRQDSSSFALDLDVISGVLNGMRPQRPPRLIDPSPDFRVVRALGKTFRFKGDKQRQVLECLHNRWLDGDDRVGVAKIVAELGFRPDKRMRDVFRKHPAWGVLLDEKDGSLFFLV
jgi:hypothetical protein